MYSSRLVATSVNCSSQSLEWTKKVVRYTDVISSIRFGELLTLYKRALNLVAASKHDQLDQKKNEK